MSVTALIHSIVGFRQRQPYPKSDFGKWREAHPKIEVYPPLDNFIDFFAAACAMLPARRKPLTLRFNLLRSVSVKR